MAEKKIILAVAGAGKTYHICNHIDPSRKSLILTYTNGNIKNIQRELIKTYGEIPSLVTVQTFDSFVYNKVIHPYEPLIFENFKEIPSKTYGVTLQPPPASSLGKGVHRRSNPYYFKKESIWHYIEPKSKRYYLENMCELMLYCKSDLLMTVAKGLNELFDHIWVDEFQDFTQYDFKFLLDLAKKLNNVTFVGDYYQHSSYMGKQNGKPYHRRNGVETPLDEFLETIPKSFQIDKNSLANSRRCCSEVCRLIREATNIPIHSAELNEGKVIWIRDIKQLRKIIENNSIKKLVYNKAQSYTFNAVNWGYSKGDTYDEACVILTGAASQIEDGVYTDKSGTGISRNLLYIALTRSKGNLYLVKEELFSQISREYKKV